MKKFWTAAALAAALTAANTSANAGGVLGDAINMVAPGVGTALDEGHRQFKHANPSYGQAEEDFTNDVRESIGLERHCEPLYNKWGKQVGCE